MKLATDETVLADFDDVTFEHHGIVSRFFRDGRRFMVHTEGPTGEMEDFEVKYVFGYEPLQQYMIDFPGVGQQSSADSLPRVQVLRLCWDTEAENWFYLAPPDVREKLDPSDDLHWTGIAQRWNNMCAECHSTDYQKKFTPADIKDVHTVGPLTDEEAGSKVHNIGQYQSMFMEINVSCEACHGPGSLHVELAQMTFPGWSRERGYGLANLKIASENQIQACAPCHSRRNVVHGDFKAGNNFYDHYSNQLLTEGIYYPDGQILDEDYVHGSFIQSKMYHKGIKCSDCHDPHTAKLKHSGNEVCTSCHQHPTAKYDSVGHHFHKPGTAGAQCVNCHMPSTTYMAVDARRDHSFRIPRPDLSTELGTPNACTNCHLNPENVAAEKREGLVLYQDWMLAARQGDEEVQKEIERVNTWCDDACNKWYGENRRRDEHFGIAIAAAQQGKPEAADKLESLLGKRGYEAPVIARATALQYLAQIDPERAAYAAADAIEDEHPLLRSTATSVLPLGGNISKNGSLLQQALADPVRSVRTEAARNLLEFPQSMWRGKTASEFRNAIKELQNGLQFNNDRAGAHLALGILSEQMGRENAAVSSYEDAIIVEPLVTGARSNLAALLDRNIGGVNLDSDSSKLLQSIVEGLRKQELPLLERDARLLPNSAPLEYRLGLAYYVDGQMQAAYEHLVLAANLESEQPSYAQAAAMLCETMKKWSEAIRWAEHAVEVSGGAPSSVQLLQSIKANQKASR
ncbi:MAG: hypothetical protein AAF483_23795 [Planctomycetota bacterium]